MGKVVIRLRVVFMTPNVWHRRYILATDKESDAMWNTPVGRLRLIGWVEGVSFILLLGIAMPHG